MNTEQWITLAIFAVGLVLYDWIQSRGKKP
jgi:hypothetical protein